MPNPPQPIIYSTRSLEDAEKEIKRLEQLIQDLQRRNKDLQASNDFYTERIRILTEKNEDLIKQLNESINKNHIVNTAYKDLYKEYEKAHDSLSNERQLEETISRLLHTQERLISTIIKTVKLIPEQDEQQ